MIEFHPSGTLTLRYYDEQPPMFTVYIDDSGTDPKQPTAIAAALIVPAKRVPALDRDWAVFGATFGFGDSHASECAARNPHSAFGEWVTKKSVGPFAEHVKL